MSRAEAEFSLNFQPQPGYSLPGLPGYFSTTHQNSDNGSNLNPSLNQGMTRYLMMANFERPEIVVDPSNGNKYYHMIVGDLADGFIQETYIQMGFGSYGSDAETMVGGPPASASGGSGQYDWAAGGKTDPNSTFANGYDPLDMDKNAYARKVTSGNGTANPTRVLMRQIVSDGEIMIEFMKDRYAYKPRISQVLLAPDITAEFDIDMRHIRYDDNSNVAEVINNVQLWEPAGLPPGSASFDVVSGSQQADVTAGRYVYVDGAGFGGAEGSYQYVGGGFDHTGIDWKSYIDPEVHNPWSFAGSKVP